MPALSPSPCTEDTLVQQTTADCLAGLGWESVYAHDREDFGSGGLDRASDREMVLTRPLRAALAALNPDLPDEAYDEDTMRNDVG